MIAPIFFLMLFASFETGMMYFADMSLENGVVTTGRLVRTGQAQQAGLSASQFREVFCAEVQVLLSCDGDKLLIDVRSFASFGGSGYQNAFDENGNVSGNLNAYQPGQSSATGGTQDIVLVRAFYKWPLYTPMFAEYFGNVDGTSRLLSASVAFRNEPY